MPSKSAYKKQATGNQENKQDTLIESAPSPRHVLTGGEVRVK